MLENDRLIYKTECMVSNDDKNYKGIVALYNDRCLFYNGNKLINEFQFDITKADVIVGKAEISFLDLYKKEKTFVQLSYLDNYSIKYFLTDQRCELFIGKFEQRKTEKKNYSLVVKAIEYGYKGKPEDAPEKKTISSNESVDATSLIRKPDQLLTWEDLLTPVPWRDYYHTLNSAGKRVYDAILNGIVECKEIVKIDNIILSDEAVGAIYHYILWDNPAIFCIGEYAMWKAVTDDGHHVRITSLCGGSSTEQGLRNEVLLETKKFLEHKKLYSWTDIQKEKYVHDYMIKNWPYDFTKGNDGARLEPYTVYGALVQKTAVCEGFAKTAKMLLDILGVHTMVVSGEVVSAGEGHAWNVVSIGNATNHLDITYDMSLTGGRQYAIRYDYFNVMDSDLLDRKWHDRDIVWKCNSFEYNYAACTGGLISSEANLQEYLQKGILKQKSILYLKFVDDFLNKTNNMVSNIKDHLMLAKKKTGRKVRAQIVVSKDIRNLYVLLMNY